MSEAGLRGSKPSKFIERACDTSNNKTEREATCLLCPNIEEGGRERRKTKKLWKGPGLLNLDKPSTRTQTTNTLQNSGFGRKARLLQNYTLLASTPSSLHPKVLRLKGFRVPDTAEHEATNPTQQGLHSRCAAKKQGSWARNAAQNLKTLNPKAPEILKPWLSN